MCLVSEVHLKIGGCRLTRAFGGKRQSVVFDNAHNADIFATDSFAIQKITNGNEAFWEARTVLGTPLASIG